MRHLAALLLLVLLAAVPLAAQRVDSTNTHTRMLTIDRVITDEQGHRMPAHAAGMLGFVAVYAAGSDLCLVEYVALKHEDFNALRADADKDRRVRIFDKGRTKRNVFEAAVRAAGFTNVDFEKFWTTRIVRVP